MIIIIINIIVIVIVIVINKRRLRLDDIHDLMEITSPASFRKLLKHYLFFYLNNDQRDLARPGVV